MCAYIGISLTLSALKYYILTSQNREWTFGVSQNSRTCLNVCIQRSAISSSQPTVYKCVLAVPVHVWRTSVCGNCRVVSTQMYRK